MSCEAATAPILSPADLALAKLLAVKTGSPDSFARVDMNDILALISSAAFGFQRYETVGARDADTTQPNGTLSYVWNNNDDPDDTANGFYAWDLSATDWIEAPWIANALSTAVNDLVEAVDGQFAAIETKLDNMKRQEVVYCGVTASTGSQISLQTAYGTETTPDIYRLYRFQLNSTYPGPSVNVPTVALNGGAPVPVYDHAGQLIDREQLKAQHYVTLQYRTAFGGIFSVVSPAKAHTSPPIILTDTESSSGNAYVTRTRNLDYLPDNKQLYLARFNGTQTASHLSLQVNSAPALPVYELNGGVPVAGRIQAGQLYTLQYVEAGDPDDAGGAPYWIILDPAEDVGQRQALVAAQIAEQATLSLRERWRDDNLAAFDAIPRTTLFDHDFATDVDAGMYRARLGGEALTEEYIAYDWNAEGYIEKDLSGNDGLWWDANHVWPGPGFLQLPLVLQPTWHAALSSSTPLKNAILTTRLRLVDFELPPGAVLAWHFQTIDNSPGGSGKAVNYISVDRLVSDAAGFGIGPDSGISWPHLKPSVADSGWFDFSVRFIPDDAFWQPLATSVLRGNGPDGTNTYSTAPIRRALEGTFLSMILVVLFPQQINPRARPARRAKGTLQLDSIRLDVVT